MNIIYSITNRTSSLIRGIVFLLLGFLLVIRPESMLNFIVMILAALLIVISVTSIILMYRGNKKEIGGGSTLLSRFAFTSMIISLVFGVLLFAFPSFFTEILVLLFGLFLLLLGGTQIANMVASAKYVKLPLWLYISPILITICGVICFFQPFKAKNAITIFFGAVVMLYGIAEIISSVMLRRVKSGEEVSYVEVKKGSDE